jgi:hypothetical protein
MIHTVLTRLIYSRWSLGSNSPIHEAEGKKDVKAHASTIFQNKKTEGKKSALAALCNADFFRLSLAPPPSPLAATMAWHTYSSRVQFVPITYQSSISSQF